MNNRKIGFLILVLVLMVVITAYFPPLGDDFNRLNKEGDSLSQHIEAAKGHYEKLNGRIIGNFISYVFISRVPRTIIKVVSLGIFLCYMMKAIRSFKAKGFLLALSVLLFLPPGIFRQVYGWSSGFYNYFPPIVIILVLFNRLVNKRVYRPIDYLINIILAFAGTLFMENLSLYLVAMPFLIYLIFRPKIQPLLASGLGALAGTALMFSSPIYGQVVAQEDSYRSIAGGSLSEIIVDKWEIFSRLMIAQNYLILILFLLVFGLVAYRLRAKNQKWQREGVMVILLLGMFALSFIKENLLASLVSIVLHLVFYILIVLRGFERRSYYNKLLAFAGLSMALAMGPLLPVNPIIQRNFFTPAVFNGLIIFSLYRIYRREESLPDLAWEKVLAPLSLAMLLLYTYVSIENYGVYMERDRILREAIDSGATEVVIPKMAHPWIMGGQASGSLGRLHYRERQEDVEIKVEE